MEPRIPQDFEGLVTHTTTGRGWIADEAIDVGKTGWVTTAGATNITPETFKEMIEVLEGKSKQKSKPKKPKPKKEEKSLFDDISFI